MKELREIKARLMLGGNIHATDSDALAVALDIAKAHESEIRYIDPKKKLKYRTAKMLGFGMLKGQNLHETLMKMRRDERKRGAR